MNPQYPTHRHTSSPLQAVDRLEYATRRISRKYNVSLPLARVVAELVVTAEVRR